MTLEELLSRQLPLVHVLLLIAALFVCWIFAWIISAQKTDLLKKQIRRQQREIDSLEDDTAYQQEMLTNQKVQSAKLATLIKTERKNAAEKLALLEDAREELRLQFQTLAQEIFEEKSKTFSTQNNEKLSALLHPFQNQLDSFRKRIDTLHLDETRERVSLKSEIHHLRELNQRINEEASNLTRALKGDQKLQGNWGELILERVLEHCGLRKGREYDTQGGFRNAENQLLKPDVILHLPEGKDIIIDSKVSLIAWERYVNCEDETARAPHFKAHVKAIRDHINSLTEKDYTSLKNIRSLDFVLMFMPIESAYVEAFHNDEQLFADALTKKIIVVTPTTLLATMRTIENVWRYEHQNRNAKEIADRAAAMYDKLCSFVEDMEKIGKQLATCTQTYDMAMTKLSQGRGNLLSQADKFTELGVKAKKSLPRNIIDDDLPN
jgi:DNA recombination protein RmuC